MWCARLYGLEIKLLMVSLLGLVAQPASAQVNAAVDGTGTTVNAPIVNQFDITNGTRSGNNLFHSFQQFSLGAGQAANFVVPADVQNVLARVSGGTVSIINGQLQLTGGNSNLYLMNPAGIVFGNSAHLHLPAAFVATTANGIGFGNGQWFSASGRNNFAQLTGTPIQFAFTETQAGSIINARKLGTKDDQPLSTKDDQPLALIGGTIVATQYWENNGALALVTVQGVQVVELRLPGQQLSLSVKVSPIQPIDAIPNRWIPPIAKLPELLTGGDVRNATQIRVENGQILLTATSTQAVTVKSGDIVVDSVKIFNRNQQSRNIYDVWIDAQNTFRALGTVPNESINSTIGVPNTPVNSNISGTISIPVSIRTKGNITIHHGGQAFVEAIGYQRDAKGLVLRDQSGDRVLFDGQRNDDSNLPETLFKYEDTGLPFTQTDSEGLKPIYDPTFNPSQDNGMANYAKGLVIVQDSEGNGALLGSLQDSSLSGTRNIQITTNSRLGGRILPPPRPPEITCRPQQQAVASSNTRSRNAGATACQSGGNGLAGLENQPILQVLPSVTNPR